MLMEKDNVAVAEVYYSAVAQRDIAGMEKCLHPAVQLKNPLGVTSGREAVLEAAKKILPLFESLRIRTMLSAGDQVVVIWDLVFPAPIGNMPSASLLTFRDGLIANIEIFCDLRAFETSRAANFT